jgi:putative protease
MALFRFFKSLFTRNKKKKVKKPYRKSFSRKKIRNGKRKPKRILRKSVAKKAKKKSTRKAVKKTRKAPAARKRKAVLKRAKAKHLPEEKEIGVITHYFDKISVGIIKLKGPLAVSEHIHIKGSSTDFRQVVSSMQYNHKDITLAERGLEIGIKVDSPTRENDIVYRVI